MIYSYLCRSSACYDRPVYVRQYDAVSIVERCVDYAIFLSREVLAEQRVEVYFCRMPFPIACVVKLYLGDVFIEQLRPVVKAVLSQHRRLIDNLLSNNRRVDCACDRRVPCGLRLQLFGTIEAAVIADQFSIRVALFVAKDDLDLLPVQLTQRNPCDIHGGAGNHQIVHFGQMYLFYFFRAQYQIIAAHAYLARRIYDYATPAQITLLCALVRANP